MSWEILKIFWKCPGKWFPKTSGNPVMMSPLIQCGIIICVKIFIRTLIIIITVKYALMMSPLIQCFITICLKIITRILIIITVRLTLMMSPLIQCGIINCLGIFIRILIIIITVTSTLIMSPLIQCGIINCLNPQHHFHYQIPPDDISTNILLFNYFYFYFGMIIYLKSEPSSSWCFH